MLKNTSTLRTLVWLDFAPPCEAEACEGETGARVVLRADNRFRPAGARATHSDVRS